jgi:cytosine deaminase
LIPELYRGQRERQLDQIIRRAQLPERPAGELVDIGIKAGSIVAIDTHLAADAAAYDAAGHLVCGGLIESHIHLDKGRLLEVVPAPIDRQVNPVHYSAGFKAGISAEDIYGRAERTLRESLLHGTTRIRTHVEVDPVIGMRGFDAIQALARDYRWAVDIDLCVFPQDGLTNVPGTDELLVEGLRRGAKVLGAAPRYDTDAHGQIRRIFALAREYDVDIDMHLDVGPTAQDLDVYLVADLTEEYGLGGRVTVGHMAKLSLMPPAELAKVAQRLANVGVAVTVLPATDLFLMGRNHDHAVPFDPLWGLFADPDCKPPCQYSASKPAGRIAGMFRNDNHPLRPHPELAGLRHQGWKPRRHRRDRLAIARSRRRRNPSSFDGFQERRSNHRLRTRTHRPSSQKCRIIRR